MRWLEVDNNIALPEEQVNWLRKLAGDKKAYFKLHSIEKVGRAVLDIFNFQRT